MRDTKSNLNIRTRANFSAAGAKSSNKGKMPIPWRAVLGILHMEQINPSLFEASSGIAWEPLASENQIAEGLHSDPAEMVGKENVLEPQEKCQETAQKANDSISGILAAQRQ
ncbi:hypothetical protein C8J57DRAFT_1242511 [Mycena rebaudengoi]|nr:hypothetical protein C8J57DRAFT_1242511 [Mycena rebaudengoi]